MYRQCGAWPLLLPAPRGTRASASCEKGKEEQGTPELGFGATGARRGRYGPLSIYIFVYTFTYVYI